MVPQERRMLQLSGQTANGAKPDHDREERSLVAHGWGDVSQDAIPIVRDESGGINPVAPGGGNSFAIGVEKIAGPPTPASGASASRNPPYADCLTTSPGGGGVEQKRPARVHEHLQGVAGDGDASLEPGHVAQLARVAPHIAG